MLTETDLELLCKTAKSAAVASGEYIQSQFDEHYVQQTKEGGNSLASQIVTEVDFKAQEIILEHLHESIQKYDLGLLTEEAADDSSRLEKDYFWCVDPMDGTLAFTEGRTGYAVSIALVSQSGDAVVGVVYIPDSKDCYTAIKGAGLRLNGQAFEHTESADRKLHFYRDKSLQSESYYDLIINNLNHWAQQNKYKLKEHLGYGAVRNALSVLHFPRACYFKFPKRQKGGGSIWDFAATRLFFEERGLLVSDSFGKMLYLNNPESTFINKSGVLYATDVALFDLIRKLSYQVDEH